MHCYSHFVCCPCKEMFLIDIIGQDCPLSTAQWGICQMLYINSTDKLREMQTKGRGVTNYNNPRTYFMGPPGPLYWQLSYRFKKKLSSS